MSDQDPTPPDATPTPEGTGADPAARPGETEPNGPLAGLVATTAAEAKEEAAQLRGEHDPEAEALLAQMGVEEEGIESGQILGLVLVTFLSIGALIVVLIFLFIIPFQAQTDQRAEASAQNVEQRTLRAEAVARLDQYSRDGETYGLPITQAQALIAARYADAGGRDLPEDRQDWNTAFGQYTPAPATVAAPDAVDPTVYRFPADGREQVGVDVDAEETVDVVGEEEEFDGAFE